MIVTKTAKSDVGELRPDGFVDYAYVYTDMEFADGDRVLLARAYDDTPDEVSIRSLRRDGVLTYGEALYAEPLVRQAHAHLLDEGFSTVRMLTEAGYQALDPTRLAKVQECRA